MTLEFLSHPQSILRAGIYRCFLYGLIAETLNDSDLALDLDYLTPFYWFRMVENTLKILLALYVCMSVRTYVCPYVCMYVRTYVCMSVRMYVCPYVCMYVRTYARITFLFSFSFSFRVFSQWENSMRIGRKKNARITKQIAFLFSFSSLTGKIRCVFIFIFVFVFVFVFVLSLTLLGKFDADRLKTDFVLVFVSSLNLLGKFSTND
jgi:hypothetical protein